MTLLKISQRKEWAFFSCWAQTLSDFFSMRHYVQRQAQITKLVYIFIQLGVMSKKRDSYTCK